MADAAGDWGSSDDIFSPGGGEPEAESGFSMDQDGPAMAGISDGAMKKLWRRQTRVLNSMGLVGHHMLSFYGAVGANYKQLFQKYGFTFSLQSLRNMLPLTQAMHGRGRHLAIYHVRALRFIEERLIAAGKKGGEALRVLHQALDDLALEIAKDPDKWFKL
jgi:hypothetical protein